MITLKIKDICIPYKVFKQVEVECSKDNTLFIMYRDKVHYVEDADEFIFHTTKNNAKVISEIIDTIKTYLSLNIVGPSHTFCTYLVSDEDEIIEFSVAWIPKYKLNS